MQKHRHSIAWVLFAAFMGGVLLAPSVHFAYMALSDRYALGGHDHEGHGTQPCHTPVSDHTASEAMVRLEAACEHCGPCPYAKLFFSLHWSTAGQHLAITSIHAHAELPLLRALLLTSAAPLPFSARAPPRV